MILDAIITAVLSVCGFVVDLFPDVTVPGWLQDGIPDSVASVATQIGGMSAWVPFSVGQQALTFVLAAMGIAVTIVVIRIVASFFTAGGGAT